MTTLKFCPVCDSQELYPHCAVTRAHPYFSHTCDLVKCHVCGNIGTLDGAYWPDDENGKRNSVAVTDVINTMAKLRVEMGR